MVRTVVVGLGVVMCALLLPRAALFLLCLSIPAMMLTRANRAQPLATQGVIEATRSPGAIPRSCSASEASKSWSLVLNSLSLKSRITCATVNPARLSRMTATRPR